MPSIRAPRSGLLGASALVIAALVPALLTGCGTTQQPGSMQPGPLADSNVPAPPNVDRSKCSDKGKQVITADTNQDKKPDVWKFFTMGNQNGQDVQVLSCKQVDLNHDGKIDIVYYYDDKGAMTMLEEFDLDFDGKLDMWTYRQNGKIIRQELDTNFDSKPDVWKFFEGEKLARIERSSKKNGKVDVWEYYEGGKLDRIGYDTTGSGQVDRWDRAPEDATETASAGSNPGGLTRQPAPLTPSQVTPPPPTPEATPAPAPAPKKK